MSPKALSVIAVILVVIGVGYLWQTHNFTQYGVPSASFNASTTPDAPVVEDPNSSPSTDNSINASIQINNFDECIAAGNKPLADAPDKCLTKDGHVFIQGVEE